MIRGPETLEEARAHHYGVWGGNPNGYPYHEGRCAEEVRETGRAMVSYQCQRKSGYGPNGLYCKQHDPAAVAARAAAASKKYEDDQNRRMKFSDISALRRAAHMLSRSQPDAARACRDLAKKLESEGGVNDR